MRYSKVQRHFYNQLDISEVTDNKQFWKTVRPFISDKSSSKSRITLIEEGKTMSNKSEVAETLDNFFVTSDPIDQILFWFSSHPSIQKFVHWM